MSESEKTIQEQCYGTCWGAQQRIDELTQQLNAANDRIKRLEEAGDALEYASVVLEAGEDPNGFEKLLLAQREWREAKEAKP